MDEKESSLDYLSRDVVFKKIMTLIKDFLIDCSYNDYIGFMERHIGSNLKEIIIDTKTGQRGWQCDYTANLDTNIKDLRQKNREMPKYTYEDIIKCIISDVIHEVNLSLQEGK
jgi:hypothetical protein